MTVITTRASSKTFTWHSRQTKKTTIAK